MPEERDILPWGPEQVESYVAKVEAEYARLRPQLPDIPPGDLFLILSEALRPFGTGKTFFLRPLPNGTYVL